MKLLFLPWVCKPLYAPLIERTRTKDWWLTASMLSLCLTCLSAAAWSSPQHVWTLSALMLALNVFSAAQDVATDSLAVRVLGPHELGVGNTIQVVAYKAGSVFAGGMLLWFRDLMGWQMMFMAFASLYALAVTLFRRYRLADAAIKDSSVQDSSSHDQEEAHFSWRKVLTVPGTAYLLFFVLFYKLCERAEQTFSLYLVDKGVPSSQLAFWSTIVRSASLLGSAYGGKLLSLKDEDKCRVGETSRAILTKYSLLRAAPIAAQLGVMTVWGQDK